MSDIWLLYINDCISTPIGEQYPSTIYKTLSLPSKSGKGRILSAALAEICAKVIVSPGKGIKGQTRGGSQPRMKRQQRATAPAHGRCTDEKRKFRLTFSQLSHAEKTV